MKRILFVCLGNICRSPTGEGVMRHLVDREGVGAAYEIDSAGTSAYHVGEPADARMRSAASRRGYELTSRARAFIDEDFERFDLIVAMDLSNLRDIRSRDPGDRYREKVRLLSEFIDGGTWGKDVPDPYYGGAQGFETVIDMVESGCEGILQSLRPEVERG